MIEYVEELQPELQTEPLSKLEVLEGGHIQPLERRSRKLQGTEAHTSAPDKAKHPVGLLVGIGGPVRFIGSIPNMQGWVNALWLIQCSQCVHQQMDLAPE